MIVEAHDVLVACAHTLQAVTVFCLSASDIKYCINQLSAFGVVAFCPVVACS